MTPGSGSGDGQSGPALGEFGNNRRKTNRKRKGNHCRLFGEPRRQSQGESGFVAGRALSASAVGPRRTSGDAEPPSPAAPRAWLVLFQGHPLHTRSGVRCWCAWCFQGCPSPGEAAARAGGKQTPAACCCGRPWPDSWPAPHEALTGLCCLRCSREVQVGRPPPDCRAGCGEGCERSVSVCLCPPSPALPPVRWWWLVPIWRCPRHLPKGMASRVLPKQKQTGRVVAAGKRGGVGRCGGRWG